MGFIQGQINTLYVHAKDKFDNIGTAGISFEFDSIPPDMKLDFADRIARATFSGVDHFVVPYRVRYDDNYCQISEGQEFFSHYGVNHPVQNFTVSPSMQSGVFTRNFYLHS